RKPEVDRSASGIHSAIEVAPATRHPDISLIHPPGTVGGLEFAAAPMVEFRRVPLYPPPNGRVVDRQAALAHKFLDVTIREGIPQVPSDRTYDDHGFEVSPFEQGRPGFAHRTSLPEPPRFQICNTSLRDYPRPKL